MLSYYIRVRHTQTRLWRWPCSRAGAALGARLDRCDRSSLLSTSASKQGKIIFSGIQPTGVPHLGNYLGALRPWRHLQDSAASSDKLLFSVVDLHSLTSAKDQTAKERRRSRNEVLASFLAVGIDPQRCTLFFQSAVPAHSEMHWILSCDASMGMLSRMTQWKVKLSDDESSDIPTPASNTKQREKLKLGLFSYPVLQAADILVHRGTHVPVGEDQAQHVEFARECAQVFNAAYGEGKEILPLPHPQISKAKRVMSLAEPTRKMSKSHLLPRSRIMINDSPDEIKKKIKVALTDSDAGVTYDAVKRPGVSNLVEIWSHLDDQERTCAQIAEDARDWNLRQLKEKVADVIINHLEPIRDDYERFMGDSYSSKLQEIADEGALKARESADETMKVVREVIGV